MSFIEEKQARRTLRRLNTQPVWSVRSWFVPWFVKENDYAIWTVSWFGDSSLDCLGRRVRVFSRRRIFDSLVAHFCGDLVAASLVHGWHENGLSRVASERNDRVVVMALRLSARTWRREFIFCRQSIARLPARL
jgi:hypothetical protein